VPEPFFVTYAVPPAGSVQLPPSVQAFVCSPVKMTLFMTPWLSETETGPFHTSPPVTPPSAVIAFALFHLLKASVFTVVSPLPR